MPKKTRRGSAKRTLTKRSRRRMRRMSRIKIRRGGGQHHFEAIQNYYLEHQHKLNPSYKQAYLNTVGAMAQLMANDHDPSSIDKIVQGYIEGAKNAAKLSLPGEHTAFLEMLNNLVQVVHNASPPTTTSHSAIFDSGQSNF